MTKFYQLRDLTISDYAKQFLKRKCNKWYSRQVKAELDDGINTDDVPIWPSLNLFTLDSLQNSTIT